MKRLLFILLATLSIAFNQPVLAQKHHAKHAKKHVQKEAIVYVTRTGSKYHSSYCSYLRYSSIPMKKSEAIAEGYTPCSRCNP
jgi:biotin synthase-like enzyme